MIYLYGIGDCLSVPRGYRLGNVGGAELLCVCALVENADGISLAALDLHFFVVQLEARLLSARLEKAENERYDHKYQHDRVGENNYQSRAEKLDDIPYQPDNRAENGVAPPGTLYHRAGVLFVKLGVFVAFEIAFGCFLENFSLEPLVYLLIELRRNIYARQLTEKAVCQIRTDKHKQPCKHTEILAVCICGVCRIADYVQRRKPESNAGKRGHDGEYHLRGTCPPKQL